MTDKKTDWDRYYQSSKPAVTVTRKISTNKIHSTIREYIENFPKNICELGGANSCFLSSFLNLTELNSYKIIDLNSYGLSLLEDIALSDSRLTFEKGDVLSLGAPKKHFDLVYSVGLIEHFSPVDTAKSIATHFQLCKPEGYVLITFPTPTWLYRVTRKLAEILKIWHFHDERPLNFQEVMATCDQHGELIHRSINWKIVLTQGYVLYKKKGT